MVGGKLSRQAGSRLEELNNTSLYVVVYSHVYSVYHVHADHVMYMLIMETILCSIGELRHDLQPPFC